MKYPIIDTHTHLYFGAYKDDRAEVIERDRQSGVVHHVLIGCDEASNMAALELARKEKDISVVLGIHPCDVDLVGNPVPSEYRYDTDYNLDAKTVDDLFEKIEAWYLKNKDIVVGFGETGFDLYHRNTAELEDLQKYCFERHIGLCKKYDMPVVFHIRDAKEVFEEQVEKHFFEGLEGVVHCFSEGPEFAKKMVEEYGFYIGIGGVATKGNAENVREAIKVTPIEKILTETDAPFLVPRKIGKERGNRRNESGFLTEVVELIAELKEMGLQECAEQLVENAKKFYNL